MSRIIVSMALVVAAAAATTFGLAGPDAPGGRAVAARSTAPAAAAPWRRLPALPGSARIDVDGASTAVAGGRLYVSVVDRGTSERAPSRVLVFRLADGRWDGPLGHVTVNRGAPVSLLAGERPCLVAPRAAVVEVRCLQGSRWPRLGTPVFSTTYPEPTVGFAGAFASAGRPVVLRAAIEANGTAEPGQAAIPAGRITHTAFVLDGGAWHETAPIDPSAERGTQRPAGFTWRGRPCVAYDRLPASTTLAPDVAIQCLDGDRWDAAGVPPLSLGTAVGATSRPDAAISVDGVTVTHDRPVLGLDYFHGRHVDWPLVTLADGAWRRTAGGADNPVWDEQGSLYAIRDRLFAVRFDQRFDRGGMRTRIVVATAAPGGRQATVGQPLVADARFYGPLYWDLEALGERLYAMATVPDARQRRNHVVVFDRQFH